ncbi:MAG: ParB N-terminal domain-containing protein [Oscillospiraceae bacterium]|nr:ParB N-terminal domain-containing protein [Oscillospiraceae bacterium]MCL2277910.1 ParB N-terminal domain-containing protein [Oscillospiraceae bacterium]
MAKNFKKAASAKTFSEVGKKDAEKAKVITVQMIADDCLFDYPNNDLDINDTADLEKSIDEHGFFDPIEVTAFGMPEGRFMIVSGHRRRNAGRKKGISTFPCLVKSFSDANDVDSYVLSANAQRDTAKDPLLYFKFTKLAERHLEAIGFEGSVRQEIADRLGISVKHADRYLKLGRVIEPVLDMIQTEIIGVSSVEPLFTLNEDEQSVVYDMMKECLDSDNDLTRKTVAYIVSEFKKGKTQWKDLDNALNAMEADNNEYVPHELKDSGLPLHTYTEANTQPGQSGGSSNRNSEVRREFDPIAANADDADRAHAEWLAQQGDENDDDVDDAGVSDDFDSPHGEDITEEKQRVRTGAKMLNLVRNIGDCIGGDYAFSSDDVAADELRMIANTIIDIIDEMKVISSKYNISDELETVLTEIATVAK